MFWANYQELCKKDGKSASGLAKELGISSGTVTGWKNGVIPSDSSLQKIASHFGVDKWDLLSEKNTATIGDGSPANIEMKDYVMAIFQQLNFQNKIRAANELQSLLQTQLTQDDSKESH